MHNFFTILFFSFLLSSGYSQSKEQVYAGMILHIMKYVEWPGYNSDMRVGVVNDPQLTTALNKAAAGKKIHFKDVTVSRLNGVSGLEKIDVLFLPKGASPMLPQAKTVADKGKILIITEIDNGNTSGSGVNFIEENGRMKFELYLTTLESVGFKISEQLKKFAIIKS